MSYIKTLTLEHNEAAMILDKRTGELKELPPVRNPNMERHDRGLIFKKMYVKAWAILRTQLTPKELSVAHQLAMMAKPFSNSLEPLGPDMHILELADLLGENRKTIKGTIAKLASLGVIASFKVASSTGAIQSFWVFNPYLAFNGKVLEKSMADLFRDTFYAPQNTLNRVENTYEMD